MALWSSFWVEDLFNVRWTLSVPDSYERSYKISELRGYEVYITMYFDTNKWRCCCKRRTVAVKHALQPQLMMSFAENFLDYTLKKKWVKLYALVINLFSLVYQSIYLSLFVFSLVRLLLTDHHCLPVSGNKLRIFLLLSQFDYLNYGFTQSPVEISSQAYATQPNPCDCLHIALMNLLPLRCPSSTLSVKDLLCVLPVVCVTPVVSDKTVTTIAAVCFTARPVLSMAVLCCVVPFSLFFLHLTN